MSVGFSFSDDKDAALPQRSRMAVISLGEIEKTMMAGEIGEGQVLSDGSVLVDFSAIRITFHPDGSFNGRRKSMMNGKALNNEALQS